QAAAKNEGSAGKEEPARDKPRTTHTQEHPGAAANPTQPTLVRPIGNPAEAQQVIGHLSDVMDGLLALVEEETKLVRLGRLADVGRLAEKKAKLARLYLADTSRLQASMP